MKNELNLSKLLSLLPSDSEYDSKYLAWRKTEADDLEVMDYIGTMKNQGSEVTVLDTSVSYWSEDYPISFSHFPNSNADIYSDGSNYYMIYKDYGGHIPETRCRLIRKKLVVSEVPEKQLEINQPSASQLKFTRRFDSNQKYTEDFEAQYGINIPLAYKSFLVEYGGGILEHCNYYKKTSTGEDLEFEISSFYGNGNGDTSLDLGFYYVMNLGVIPRGLLPISDDGIGNQICIGHSGEYLDKIYIVWDTEEERLTDIVLLNNSFGEFVSFLS